MKTILITCCISLLSFYTSAQAILRVDNASPYDIEVAIIPETSSCSNTSTPYVTIAAGQGQVFSYAFPIITISTVRIRPAGCTNFTSWVTLGNPCGPCPTVLPPNGTFDRTTSPGGCPAPDYTFFTDWVHCVQAPTGEVAGVLVN